MGITDKLIKESDLILAMSFLHKSEIIKRVPDAANKTFLLREYRRIEKPGEFIGLEIPDPIGMTISKYKICLDMIKEDIERVAKIL